MYVNFPSFKKKQRNNISSWKIFWNLVKTKRYIFYGVIINKNGSFRYIFGSNQTVVGFINTDYLISMKHIGYYWYTKIMKWNPHVPKNISFWFFFKRKKFDNPKVQISSKPHTTFSIHPVSIPNRAKFFPSEIETNKKITGIWNPGF